MTTRHMIAALNIKPQITDISPVIHDNQDFATQFQNYQRVATNDVTMIALVDILFVSRI